MWTKSDKEERQFAQSLRYEEPINLYDTTGGYILNFAPTA
jgi:hypothetical protein